MWNSFGQTLFIQLTKFFFLEVATTGPSVYYNQSPAYNSQYLLRTAANVTPTKVISV